MLPTSAAPASKMPSPIKPAVQISRVLSPDVVASSSVADADISSESPVVTSGVSVASSVVGVGVVVVGVGVVVVGVVVVLGVVVVVVGVGLDAGGGVDGGGVAGFATV